VEAMDYNFLPIAIGLMAFFLFGYWLGLSDGVKKERKEASEWNKKIKREKDYKKETKDESDLKVK
jgi:hypothetical protein